MGRAYSDITFTPTVRETQTRMGSRAQYAFLDDFPDRGDALTAREAAFIADADHFFQATVSETGWPYVQHRGGPKGFLKVLGPRTLGFADYRGNLQYLSVGNLKKDDRIALLIIDTVNPRRLKLLGRVRLIERRATGGDPADVALLAAVRDRDYDATVERAFIIEIEGWDWNCPQHITRRFTEDEVEAFVKPLRTQLNQLRMRQGAAKTGKATVAAPLGDGPLALRIAGIRQLTPDVRAYELVAATDDPLPAFEAGAHLDLPIRLADSTLTTRSYSIASSPWRRDAYEIAVLKEPAGKGGSAAVHDAYALATRLNATAPANDFPMVAGPHRSVLIAGGIGITPIKAMAHALAATGADFVLHFACRSRQRAPFLGQLQELFSARVVIHATDEGQRLDVTAVLQATGETDHVYVCGPARLIEATHSAAAELGIDSSRVHSERFTAPPPLDSDQPFVVHLARSGRDVQVPARKTILEALEAQGLHPPASCRIGTCSTCATRVVAGTPLHRDEALTDAQRGEEHLMCICVSRAAGGDLTLDL